MTVAKTLRPLSRYGISLESGVPYEIRSSPASDARIGVLSTDNQLIFGSSASCLTHCSQKEMAANGHKRRKVAVAKTLRPGDSFGPPVGQRVFRIAQLDIGGGEKQLEG